MRLVRRVNVSVHVSTCTSYDFNAENESDTCAMLSEACGESEAMKESSVFECHKRFEEGRENVEDDEGTGVVQDLTEQIKMLKTYDIWCIQIDT